MIKRRADSKASFWQSSVLLSSAHPCRPCKIPDLSTVSSHFCSHPAGQLGRELLFHFIDEEAEAQQNQVSARVASGIPNKSTPIHCTPLRLKGYRVYRLRWDLTRHPVGAFCMALLCADAPPPAERPVASCSQNAKLIPHTNCMRQVL